MCTLDHIGKCPSPLIVKKDCIYLFLERWEGKEKEKEGNINVWLPLAQPLLGTLSCNPGMCPDWESNWPPFGSQASTQSTETHQPGLKLMFKLSEEWNKPKRDDILEQQQNE